MTLPTLSLTSWAGLAAAAAFLGSFWRQAADLLKRFCDLFICRVAIKEEAARAIMVHVLKHGRKSPFGLRVFGGIGTYVQPKKRVEVVAYEGLTNDPVLFWFGYAPMLIGSGHPMADNAPNIGNQASDAIPVFIRYIRGTLDIDALIEEATAAFNQKRQQIGDDKGPKRFNVIRLHGDYGGGEGGAVKQDSKGSGRSLHAERRDSSETLQQMQRGELRLVSWRPEDLMERANDQPPFDVYPFGAEPLALLPEIESWLAHEGWFRSKGIRWSRGILAYGPGGTGKSTFVRSVAIRFDLPLYVFDLASMDNQSFTANWKQAQQNSPAIVLFEDIDCVFDQRVFCADVSKNRDHLTFDCLLNTISGVGSSDGVLLFVTTNKLDKLDPALGVPVDGGTKSTRPGRIDRTVYFGPMEEPQRLKLAQFILSDFPEEVTRIVSEGEGETAAQFQERCAQFAEKEFWAKKKIAEVPNERLIAEALAREAKRQDTMTPF